MKVHQAASSDKVAAQDRSATLIQRINKPAGVIDNRSATSAQLQRQNLSDQSPQATQLRKHLASLNQVAQRVEDEEPVQGKFDIAQRVEEEEPVQGKFEPVQRVEEDEPVQGKFETAQRVEEEEPVQGKFDTTQRVEDEEPMQGKFSATPVMQRKEAGANNTGLPNQLKAGIESLSGMSMDHVKVHYNSAQPAQLNAHAYAQGSDIHVAPGQEQHLPHEAWHVVQQAQGRVKPTMQMKMGVPVNDDVGLETEADVMGAKAMQQRRMPSSPPSSRNYSRSTSNTVQALMTRTEFQDATPGGTVFNRRNMVTHIDAPLHAYRSGPGAGRLAAVPALRLAMQTYVALPGRDQGRVAVVNGLLADLVHEEAILTALGGANGGLLEPLLLVGGGIGNVAAIVALATALTPANAHLMLSLIPAYGGDANLGRITAHVTAVTAANAFHLLGLMAAGGGFANEAAILALANAVTNPNLHYLTQLINDSGGAVGLADLATAIGHASAAETNHLASLVPFANAAGGLAVLNPLLQAAGVAAVPSLRKMLVDAGGAAAMPTMTTVINLNHPGVGNSVSRMATVSATNLAEFTRLATAVPEFLQAGTPGMPGTIQTAVDNYNYPFVGNISQRIGQVEWAHFLTRHTHQYFNFGAISAQNDQWPSIGGTAAADVENHLIAAINYACVNVRFTNHVPQIINGATIATGNVGPGLDRLALLGGGATSPSRILGQFFPMPPANGALPYTQAHMEATRDLV